MCFYGMLHKQDLLLSMAIFTAITYNQDVQHYALVYARKLEVQTILTKLSQEKLARNLRLLGHGLILRVNPG